MQQYLRIKADHPDRFFHATAGLAVKMEKLITILQCGHCLVQRGMVALRRRRMLEADDVRGRTIEFNVHLSALECQVQRSAAVYVSVVLAMCQSAVTDLNSSRTKDYFFKHTAIELAIPLISCP